MKGKTYVIHPSETAEAMIRKHTEPRRDPGELALVKDLRAIAARNRRRRRRQRLIGAVLIIAGSAIVAWSMLHFNVFRY